jgi:hypothetical protein
MIEYILAAVLMVETVIVLAVLVYREHHHGPAGKPKAGAAPAVNATPHLTQADLDKLNTQAQTAFAKAVEEGAQTFHADLEGTSEQLNKLIIRITTDVVERELGEYRDSLAKAREAALGSLAQMQSAVEQKQKDLEADVDAELAKRRQYLMERLDRRLGAAVAAYVVESLGMNADLGAQRAFLLENLEHHKKELKQEVLDGNSAQ